MNAQFAQLIKYTSLSEFKVALKKLLNYEEELLDFKPTDLDTVFMNALLSQYEKRFDPNLEAFAKAERFLLSQTLEIDKEHFFERQYLMLLKELEQELYFALYELLFKFRVRMNGEFTIIFRLKQFEAFEQLLKKQLQHLSPRLTVTSRKQQSQRKTLFNRPSTLGKMLLRAFSKNQTEIELQQYEALYSIRKINGLECYQLNELEQFTKQEQKVILNVSVSNTRLVESDEDEDQEENDIPQLLLSEFENLNAGQLLEQHKVVERQNYLEYIYGNTKKLESVIMSSLPFNTKQQIEDENMISTTTLLRPLLNQQSAESVLIYGNRLPNKNFIRKEKDLWKLAKLRLQEQFNLFKMDNSKMYQTKLRVYRNQYKKKQMIKVFNNGIC